MLVATYNPICECGMELDPMRNWEHDCPGPPPKTRLVFVSRFVCDFRDWRVGVCWDRMSGELRIMVPVFGVVFAARRERAD